ncbi:MAG TPA: hypothetical protein VFV73_24205 [Streptosporangiaceae bacterium]|nr:hypothetical protein [Streptosporangiaceae bacterium]
MPHGPPPTWSSSAASPRQPWGAGQALLTARPPGRAGITAELTAWNAGNGAVLAGALLGASWAS